MRYAGIDISTKLGLGIVDVTPGTAPVMVHQEKITFPKLRGMERAGAIAQKLLESLNKFKPDVVGIEDYAISKFAGAVIVQAELTGILKYFLLQEGYVIENPVRATTLKAFLIKGNADKNQMLKAMFQLYGFDCLDDDTCDGVNIALFLAAAKGELSVSKTRYLFVKKWLTPPEKKEEK